MTDAEEVIEVAEAMQLVDAGRHGEAKRLLLSVQARLTDWPEDILGFQALRALARCYRTEHDFDAARMACGRAHAIARSIGFPQGEAIALEGLALIEMADDRIRSAAEYFAATAALEGHLGNFEGRAAAIGNYANMLINRDMEGAEPLLREALKNVSPGSFYYLSIVDNLAGELDRQGRYVEAIEYSEAAVEGFLASGRRHDAFISLRTLTRVLAGAGRMAESAKAFQRAHDLIRDLRREEVDEDHYAKYPERVRAIEANTYEVLKDNAGELSDEVLRLLDEHQIEADAANVKIGLHAYLGNKATEEGMEQLETGQYSAAIDSLIEARRHWQELQAWHSLVTVDYHLALAFVEVGNIEKALPLVFGARSMAHKLGDAWREQMTLSLLARLGERATGHDRLDCLLQARALERCIRRQLGVPADADVPTDAGVLAAELANVARDARAYDLAESYYEETLRIARAGSETLGYRFIYRLLNYQDMVRQAGRPDRANEVLAELRSAAAAIASDPRVGRALARANSRAAFEEGERTPEVLNGLLDECRAYEQARDQAQGLDLTGFAEATQPPYEDAAHVALALDNTALALGLLELSKARTLLEALRGGGPETGQDQLTAAAPPAIGAGVAITLFVIGNTITLLRLDGASGELTHARIEDDTEPEQTLPRTVRAFADAADSEHHSHASADALDAVLAHPTFQRLAETVATSIPAGREAWLVPDRYLHYAPLQLLQFATGAAVRYSIAPSLSVIATLPQTRLSQGHADIAVCGDSLGDLPFARAEARLVADAHGTVAVGGACTTEWLRTAVTPSTGILHIACHGRYDRARPARSGLILAVPQEDQLADTSAAQLLTLPEVAQLPLDGVIVVLSACSSGMETVRTGNETSGLVSALLAAKAATVIAAQWPINDLSAMLLMTRFHRRLTEQATSVDLLATLESAAADVRDLTGADLIETGFESAEQVLALGGTQQEAIRLAGGCLNYAFISVGDEVSVKLVNNVIESPGAGATGSASRFEALQALRPSPARTGAARPFANPRHWGAFKVVGRVTTGVG